LILLDLWIYYEKISIRTIIFRIKCTALSGATAGHCIVLGLEDDPGKKNNFNTFL